MSASAITENEVKVALIKAMQIFKSSRKHKILHFLGHTFILVAIFCVHLSDGRILSMKNIEGNTNIERVDTMSFKESRKLLVNKDLLLLCVFFFFAFLY